MVRSWRSVLLWLVGIKRITLPCVVYGASAMIQDHNVDAVVCIGVLIKGDTLHFEHVAEAVAQGIADINARGDVPIIFGVLPCLSEDQAKPRAARKTGYGYGW